MPTPGVNEYPTALDTVVSLGEIANNASATLVSGIDDDDLLIPVTQPGEFPDSGFVTLVDSLINPTAIEIALYTSKSGDDLVVPPGGRGAQGTTPQAFSAGSVVEMRPTARLWTVLADAIIALQTKLGIGADTPGGSAQALLSDSSGESAWRPLTFDDVTGFPPWLSMHLRNDGDVSLANSTTETNLIGASQHGSTKTLAAGLAQVGQTFRIRLYGRLTGAAAAGTLRLRLKLGSTTIADTTAIAIANSSDSLSGGFVIKTVVSVRAVGASGSVFAHSLTASYVGVNGGPTAQLVAGGSATTVDLTADQDFVLTAQFGTANAANTITITSSHIERSR